HHAARELLGVGALEALEADFRDEAAGDRGALVGGHAADLKAELEIVLHGEPGKQGVGLEHHAAVLARLGDPLAVQIDGARRRLDQAGYQPQQAGFAAARRTDDHRELVLVDLEGDAVECRDWVSHPRREAHDEVVDARRAPGPRTGRVTGYGPG